MAGAANVDAAATLPTLRALTLKQRDLPAIRPGKPADNGDHGAVGLEPGKAPRRGVCVDQVLR